MRWALHLAFPAKGRCGPGKLRGVAHSVSQGGARPISLSPRRRANNKATGHMQHGSIGRSLLKIPLDSAILKRLRHHLELATVLHEAALGRAGKAHMLEE